MEEGQKCKILGNVPKKLRRGDIFLHEKKPVGAEPRPNHQDDDMTPVAVPAQGGRLAVNPLIPLAAPAVFSAFRYTRVIRERERHNKTSRVAFGYNWDAVPVLSSSLSSQGHRSVSSEGLPIPCISSSSSIFLIEDQGGLSGGIPVLPNKRRSSMRVQAHKSSSGSLRYPAQTEKPEWWWRTLACVPYLVSLQISDTGFYVQPFLEHYDKFEDLIFYIPGAVKRWSMWFPMLYCYLSYIGVVKNKEWPHFFRYHVIMAMLLETALQVVWHSSNFMPLIHFKGTFGMYYWAAVGFIYIFLMLECIRCALGGKYVKIPFVSESALIHTLYHVGGFHKPF